MYYAGLAQSVEHGFYEPKVAGSSPVSCIIFFAIYMSNNFTGKKLKPLDFDAVAMSASVLASWGTFDIEEPDTNCCFCMFREVPRRRSVDKNTMYQTTGITTVYTRGKNTIQWTDERDGKTGLKLDDLVMKWDDRYFMYISVNHSSKDYPTWLKVLSIKSKHRKKNSRNSWV